MVTEFDCMVAEFVWLLSLDWIDDRLYSAILRSLEQTHCTCMRFCMSD